MDINSFRIRLLYGRVANLLYSPSYIDVHVHCTANPDFVNASLLTGDVQTREFSHRI
jgi:hypothetical protein